MSILRSTQMNLVKITDMIEEDIVKNQSVSPQTYDWINTAIDSQCVVKDSYNTINHVDDMTPIARYIMMRMRSLMSSSAATEAMKREGVTVKGVEDTIATIAMSSFPDNPEIYVVHAFGEIGRDAIGYIGQLSKVKLIATTLPKIRWNFNVVIGIIVTMLILVMIAVSDITAKKYWMDRPRFFSVN